MNRTLAFARLDYLTIKPYLSPRNLLLFLGVFCLIGFGTKQPATLNGMIMMYGVIFSTNPFAVGDQNGIDTLYASLPIRRRNIVAGRYLFVLSLNLATVLLSIIFSCIIWISGGQEISVAEIAWSIAALFVVFTFVEAIQLPIYFRLGYAKAKFLAYLPLICLPAALIAATAIGGEDALSRLADLAGRFAENLAIIIPISAAVWAGLIFLSYKISLEFYQNREF